MVPSPANSNRLRQSKGSNPMRKKVAVTQRVEKNIEYGETRDTLDFEICKLIVECDALPVPVPNALNTKKQVQEWLLVNFY